MMLEQRVTDQTIAAVINLGCEFEGKLCFHGVVRIGGVFKGEIYTPDTLIISPGAKVDASVDAGVILIAGEVSGVMRAKYRVEIQKPAVFKGDLITPSLKVEDGVIFEGSSKMAHN